MKQLTLAHISDLHLSSRYYRDNIRNTKQVLEYIKALNADHILVTGDMTADGQHKDYELARSILKSFKLLDPARMSIVIGNHDIFGGIHMAEEILDFPRRCKKTAYQKKIMEFKQYFQELFQDCQFTDTQNPFPYIKPLGDLLLIGLNSVAEYSSVKNPVGSNGKVSKNQIQRLDQMLSKGEFTNHTKIVLIHHHFKKIKKSVNGTMHSIWGAVENQTMKLRSKRDLLNLFRKHSINLVVHGHLHENREYTKKGIRFMNGGGSILNNDLPQLYVNIIKITSAGVTTELRVLRSALKPLIERVDPLQIPSYISVAAS